MRHSKLDHRGRLYGSKTRTACQRSHVSFRPLRGYAGAALGAAAVQTLHAQAKPPAFQIAEVTVANEDAFSKEFLPVIGKLDMEAGGKFLVRGGKTISVEGAPLLRGS